MANRKHSSDFGEDDEEEGFYCQICGNPFEEEELESYWYTTPLNRMLMGQKTEQREVFLCPRCLKKARRANVITAIVGLIVFFGFPMLWILFL